MTTYLARHYYSPDGVQTTFAVPFPYLAQAHVHVYNNGAELVSGFSWSTPTTLLFSSPPPAGVDTLELLRATPSGAMLHTIQDGTINPPDINTNDTQLLYLIQETADQTAGVADVEAALSEIQNDLVLIGALLGSLSGDYIFSRPTDAVLNTPTGSEPNGYRALVYKAPTGAFAGRRGTVAEKISGVWVFSPIPKAGQRVFDNGTQLWWAYQNTWWNKLKTLVPGGVYQDFGDVPNGTLANGIKIATGQVCAIAAQGGVDSVVANDRYEPTDNSYITINFPFKEFNMWMVHMWRASGQFGATTLAAGRYLTGQIIYHMIHTEFLYQSHGDLSIWGGPRQTPDGMGGYLGYLATAGLQNAFETDNDLNYPLHALSAKITTQMVVQSNQVEVYSDGRRTRRVFEDDMVSGCVGDDEAGNLGYLYFQTGGANGPTLPYVYEIFAEPLAIQDYLPNPKFIASVAAVPQNKSKDLAYGGGAQEICRFTPGNYASYTFLIAAQIKTNGPIPGFAEASRYYLVNVIQYNGTIVVSAVTPLVAELPTSQGAAVAAVSMAVTVVVSGSDVLFKGNPSRTGTDASAYSPTCSLNILCVGSYAAFV